jgi:predicted MFS family arabinose efflux permease
VSNLLMLVVGSGAILGVVVGGNVGDALIRRRRLDGRMLVAGIAATTTAVLFLPAAFTHTALGGCHTSPAPGSVSPPKTPPSTRHAWT